VAVQVLLASLLAWIVVGAITLILVAFADRPVGSAFGLALLFVTFVALAAGAASALLREPPAVGHSFDWVLGREPIDDRATGEEGEVGGLTPLGVALVIAVEMGVVLVTTGVG